VPREDEVPSEAADLHVLGLGDLVLQGLVVDDLDDGREDIGPAVGDAVGERLQPAWGNKGRVLTDDVNI
jgi:hypothetical protein